MGQFWVFSLLFVSRALAWQHHLFTSSISTPHLYALRFDDEDNTITNIANITAHGGHPWISFSYDKGSIYAGEGDGFASYSVENTTSLLYQKSIKIANECGPGLNGRAPPYVIAELRTPFNVFGAPLGTCGTAMTVNVEGGLEQIVQAYKYDDRSNIQGLTLDPENKYLYSADEGRNGIWTHLVTENGTVQQVGLTQAPFANSGPKKVVVHPNGRFLYAALAKTNVIAIFAINQGANSERTPLTYTGLSYSLVPDGIDTSYYSTDEIYLSADANILFATARYKIESPLAVENPPSGYIRAILLTSLAEADVPMGGRTVGAGFPIRPLFHMESRTSGGLTNALAPAHWSNEYFALADSQYGMIEIWKMENLATINYTGALGQDAASPPVGGWVSQSWSPQGKIQTAEAPAPAQATQPPSQSGAPFGRPAPKAQPTAPAAPPVAPPAAAEPRPAPFAPWLPAPKQPAQSQVPWLAPPKQGQSPKQPKQPQQGGFFPFGGFNPFAAAPAGNSNQQPAAAAAEEEEDLDRVRNLNEGANRGDVQEDSGRGRRRGSNTGAQQRPAEAEESDDRRSAYQGGNGGRPVEVEETEDRRAVGNGGRERQPAQAEAEENFESTGRGGTGFRPAEAEEDDTRQGTGRGAQSVRPAEAEDEETAQGFDFASSQGRRPAESEDEETRRSTGRGTTGRATEEDDEGRTSDRNSDADDTSDRSRSRLAKVLPPNSARQAWKRQEPQQQQQAGVTVSIVASWQAPVDGFPTVSRPPVSAPTNTDTERHVPLQQIKVKPWTGSRKRGAEVAEQPETADVAYAGPAGKGCCGNAVWFD